MLRFVFFQDQNMRYSQQMFASRLKPCFYLKPYETSFGESPPSDMLLGEVS